MTVIVKHTGKKGDAGRDGWQGVGVSDVRASLIESPILNLFRANALSDAITWTRNDEGSYTDRYGINRFVAGDSITYVVRSSNDFTDAVEWEDLDNNWSVTQDRNQTDPFGTTLASEITLTNTTSSTWGMLGKMSGVATGNLYRLSFYLKVISGTITSMSVQFGNLGADTYTINGTPDNTWQRFSVVVATAATGSSFRLFLRTTGAVINLTQVNVTEGFMLHAPVTTTPADTFPVVVPTVEPVDRQNQNGYLIEGQKTNLCKYSQNMNQWNTTGVPTISEYSEADPYGELNTPTLVSFAGSQTITLSQDVALTQGQSYSVSFFARAVSGEVESLTISLGGGVTTTVDVTTDWTRQVYEVVAGAQDFITFTATAGGSGVSFVLTGVQVETGQASSYIPTGEAAQTRNADLVSFAGANLPALNSDWTLQVAWRDVVRVGDAQLINCTGLDVELNASGLTVNGVTLPSAIEASGEAILVYASGTLTAYYNATQDATGAIATASSAPATVYVGATDATGSVPLNGFVKCLRMWPFAMTESEVKYISEVYNGNRYIDRG